MITSPQQPVRDDVPDLEAFRLRTFIESLAGTGELETHDRRVDLTEIARILDENPHAVLFRHAGDDGSELAGNVTGSRSRLALAFGVEPAQLLAEVMRRLRLAPRIVEISRDAAPAQQVVLTGGDADLTRLPVHLQHGHDGAPYISSSIDFAIDPKSGLTNVGIRRLMLRGRRETGIDLVSPSDLRAIYEACSASGEPLPVSFVVGSHPIDHVAATMRLPGNELEMLSCLRAAPVAVVRCITNGVRVPADAEYVLEGFLDARGHVEAEGPYGEFLGYYGGVKRNPVFHLTAITHRRDALFQTSTISGRLMSRTDTAQLSGLRTEAMVWRSLETSVREPVAVYATPSSGGMFNVRIALRQRVPGEAKNAIASAFGSIANVKHVFVVDPDIDVYSDEQVDWAFATRFQADRDLVVQSGLRTLPLDPSLAGARTGTKAGFDLTVPLGRGGMETLIPEPPVYDGPRFATIHDALADGPKRFVDLIAALGSRDGREIVVALEQLQETITITRDERGRYQMEPSNR